MFLDLKDNFMTLTRAHIEKREKEEEEALCFADFMLDLTSSAEVLRLGKLGHFQRKAF